MLLTVDDKGHLSIATLIPTPYSLVSISYHLTIPLLIGVGFLLGLRVNSYSRRLISCTILNNRR